MKIYTLKDGVPKDIGKDVLVCWKHTDGLLRYGCQEAGSYYWNPEHIKPILFWAYLNQDGENSEERKRNFIDIVKFMQL